MPYVVSSLSLAALFSASVCLNELILALIPFHPCALPPILAISPVL